MTDRELIDALRDEVARLQRRQDCEADELRWLLIDAAARLLDAVQDAESPGSFANSRTPGSHANLIRCWRWVGVRQAKATEGGVA